MRSYCIVCLLLLVTVSLNAQKMDADLLVYNATIYTVDKSFGKTEAMVIREGRILATGTSAALEAKYNPKERLDAKGKFIYPGFIDAHAHFVGYGMGLQTANLVGTESWDQIIDKLVAFANEHKTGWIIGRGWDQNDWAVKEFPSNEKLNQLFPDRPVLLERIDGHAAIVNQKAFELAGVTAGKHVAGGEIETKNIGGTPTLTGILVDNGIELVSVKIPSAGQAEFVKAMTDAQRNCFAVGLTTIDDCGLSAADVQHIRGMQDRGALKMRMYIMLSDAPANFAYLEKTGIIKTDRLNVRSFKVYGDGALGSRGACLIQPYHDKPGYRGFLLSTPEHFDSVAKRIVAKGFQMCTHAIGDSGNRIILQTYARYLKGHNDLRWRIEHAQVIAPADFALFGENNIVPSVQPTHATSDMYWAADRLGPDRVKGAYAYRRLLKENAWLPLGTDFPVEDISPFKTFYAAVARKDAKGWPAKGFQPENSLTREQAMRGMTIWAAKANFEENEKGSLEKGKFADFVILDQDMMTTPEKDLLKISVIRTYLNGEKVYERQ